MGLNWRNFLFSGGYLLLLPLALHFEQPGPRSAMVALLLLLALLAWLLSLRRLRAVRDTPTSRIVSAAQGYVELVGKGCALPGQPVYSPARALPCLWYRYRHLVREGDKWRQTESGESDAPFVIDDGSGRCLIDPAGADITTTRKETYTEGDNRIEEELLLAEDTLYAIGEFTSCGGGRARFDENAELGRILAEWKDDPDELRRRFDLDGNGEIDPQEWQLARQAARRELASRRAEAMAQPVSHNLSRPASGRPYLIANFRPEPLIRRYRNLVLGHGAVILASLAGLAFTLQKL